MIKVLLPCLLLAATACQSPQARHDDMLGEAWLINHGIYTSQWKDPECRAVALDLADTAKMMPNRLAMARSLATSASFAKDCEGL